jgi:hypothetical protein
MDFMVFPPGCGRSVTGFWGWDAHEAHGHHGNLPLQGKLPMAEPGIEPETPWSVVRNSDH